MANTVDLKLVVKHLSNGSLGDNLCIICLSPLQSQYEHIFTKICKENSEYCIASVLETLCKIKFSEGDNYNVCMNCLASASSAYKFYLQCKQNHGILNFYSDELLTNIENFEITEELTESLCISLPEIRIPSKFSLTEQKNENTNAKIIKNEKIKEENVKNNSDDVVIMINEAGKQFYYKLLENGSLVLLDNYEKAPKVVKKKNVRAPMTYKLCSYCPVKYMFTTKLKRHMKAEHDVDIFVCKVCKAIMEHEQEYHNHMRTHTNVYQCDICNLVFRKRETIVSHLRCHYEKMKLSETGNAHICETCGMILENKDKLQMHYENKHCKKFTCYYCGRMYKLESSFESHIQKHEAVLGGKLKPSLKKPTAQLESKKSWCNICNKYFVDERTLMWHQRLHSNERPFVCDVCGRGFVSLNRRNQHALTAHTAPQRRCPLCPALFHLTSMVNTHVKKVHLKVHKRRKRVTKHKDVHWRTETVPLQELSVDIQRHILELQQF